MGNWLIAIRIKTLPAATSPVILGTALAFHDGDSNSFILFMTLLAAVFIQIGANFANDVYDFQKGTDRDDRLGPKRATQSGLITPEEMKTAMWRIFALAIFVGFYLAWVGGWPIVFIGLASIAAGIAYTGGPYPLGYHGWGDAFVFIFFGLIAVPATYYLQTGFITNNSLWMGAALGMLSTSILVVNNIRDMETDIVTGKKTLAIRLGKSFSQIEFSILVIFPFIIPLCMWWNTKDNMSLFITLFALPIAVHLIIQLISKSGKELNNVLAGTARFLSIFTLLLSVGLII